jgi:hypothetical protein
MKGQEHQPMSLNAGTLYCGAWLNAACLQVTTSHLQPKRAKKEDKAASALLCFEASEAKARGIAGQVF